MNDNSFDEVLGLKKRAIALRNQDQFEQALDVLDEVVNRLNSLRAAKGEEKKVKLELADAHGMRGGINRRRKDFRTALDDYCKGAAIEDKDSLSTYNLGNMIMLSIKLGESSLDDEALLGQLKMAITRLEIQTRGPRSDEWWAWADLGQFCLLIGDVEGARHAYAAGRSTGPSLAEYQRSLDALEETAVAIQGDRPEQWAQIVSFVREMRATF